MSVIQKATSFTGVFDWHGSSDIHVSRCRNVTLLSTDNAMKVFKAAYKLKVATDVWRGLQAKFGMFEWLLNQSQFEDRAYCDWYAHAKMLGDTQDPTKLKNPVTGNVFHRVALHEGELLVAGIRFWCDPGHDCVEFGWRFRIESMEEEAEKVRVRVAEQAIADRAKVEEIEVELASQPYEAEEEQVKVREVAE